VWWKNFFFLFFSRLDYFENSLIIIFPLLLYPKYSTILTRNFQYFIHFPALNQFSLREMPPRDDTFDVWWVRKMRLAQARWKKDVGRNIFSFFSVLLRAQCESKIAPWDVCIWKQACTTTIIIFYVGKNCLCQDMCVFIMENYLFVCEENREEMRGFWPREKLTANVDFCCCIFTVKLREKWMIIFPIKMCERLHLCVCNSLTQLSVDRLKIFTTTTVCIEISFSPHYW
jgi:hypothetical protein